jgi:hypothetical protein
MLSITSVQQHDANIHSRVRQRYSRERDELAAHGFEELCFYSEQLGAYSAFLYLPVALVMLFKREVLGGHGRFDAGGSYMLLQHRHPSTIALPLGLGVKLYTGFTDGTLLISANFDSCLQPAGDCVVKHASKLPLADAWMLHKRRVEEMQSQGKHILQALDFNRYREMSHQEDGASMCSPSAAVRPLGNV